MEVQETESQQQESGQLERSEPPEKMPDAKKSYQEKIGAELKEWSGKIDNLRAEVEKSGAELGRMFEARMRILRDKQRAVLRKLSTLKRSREDRWEEITGGLEKSLDDLKQTLGQTLCVFKEKQQEVVERMSRRREAYVGRVEAQYSDWSARVDALKTKIEKAKTEAITRYDQQIEELRKKQLVGKEKLEELKKSGGESWGDIKKSTDRVFSDMKRSFERALSRMKRT